MPPPPPPANVYPCLDWVPQGVARTRPQRLKLTNDELKAVISHAKLKALEKRKRLGQNVQHERQRPQAVNTMDGLTCGQSSDNQSDNQHEQDDDVIMREYGLDTYDEENDNGGVENQNQGGQVDDEVSEDEAEDKDITTRGQLTRDLGNDLAALTYHASNDEDPYLRQDGENAIDVDDAEEDIQLTVNSTDNIVVAGHVNQNESSIEVYVYDNETKKFYLHHDIIQSDYPCCVKWIGHARKMPGNIAAAGYMTPDILLWDLDYIDVLEPMEELVGHKDAVIDICWNSQMKNIIASGSADKHVKIWDLDECKSVGDTKLSGKVSALEFASDNQSLLLAGDLSRNISLIDTRTSTVTNSWRLLGEVEKVRWIPGDGSTFLVSDDLGYIYYFDLRNSNNGQPASKFKAHETSITGLEFSPKYEDMLVTGSADDTIKVWDIKAALRDSSAVKAEPVLVKELTDLKLGRILSLKMCPNSPALIAVGGDSNRKSLRTYDLTAEKEGK